MQEGVKVSKHGALVVIESVNEADGLIQQRLLVSRLQASGYYVSEMTFPRVKEPAGYHVKRYLAGDYGSVADIGPYVISALYGLDRYDVKTQLETSLANGQVIVVSHYTSYGMAREGALFKNAEERRGFFIWLDNFAYQMLSLPRPDKSLILRSPDADKSAGSDSPYRRLLVSYDDMTQLFPKDFTRIDTERSGKRLTEESLSEHVWKIIEPVLPEQRATMVTKIEDDDTPAPDLDFKVPPQLTQEMARSYEDTFRYCIQASIRLKNQLLKSGTTIDEAKSIWEAILPIDILHPDITRQPELIKGLPTIPSSDTTNKSVELIDFTPRNELDSLKDILYEASDVTSRELARHISTWGYDKKAGLLQDYAKKHLRMDAADTALRKIIYRWEIFSDYRTMRRFEKLGLGLIQPQSLTPRYGYEVPELLDELGLTDLYIECFDKSLELHSKLLAAGFQAVADKVCLSGHRLRWKVIYTVMDMTTLSQPGRPILVKRLVDSMCEKLSEAHPLLAEAMIFVNKCEDPKLARLAAEKYTQFKLQQLEK